MKVTKLEGPVELMAIPEKTILSEEELQNEFDNYMAKKIAGKMHDAGLLTETEHKQVLKEVRNTFPTNISILESDE